MLPKNFDASDHVISSAGMRGEPVAEDLLRVAIGIEVGGVDEVAAEIQIGRQDLLGFLDAGAGRARVLAEGHRTEGERADPQPGPAEGDVVVKWHEALLDRRN